MSKTFFCSDLHLGHLSILKYEPMRLRAVWQQFHRDEIDFETFQSIFLDKLATKTEEDKVWLRSILKEHDDLVISNWNNIVGASDTVWFLGDLCMGRRADVQHYVSRLKGHIKMVKGNHDNYNDSVYLAAGISSVSKYPVVLKQKFILSHAPLEPFVNETESTFYNIYGHVHSEPSFLTKTSNSQCVCIERQDLRPIRIEDVEVYIPPSLNKKI